MPLIKEILTPNGAPASYHKVKTATYDLDSETVTVSVASWASQEAYQAGQGLVWMWHFDCAPVVLQNLEASVASIEPFDLATVVPDDYVAIESLKIRKWAKVKGERDAIINGGFVWDGSTFDSDPVSQSRIIGAVVLSMMAAAVGQEYSTEWVLADNTIRTLSGSDMQMVGATLGTFVQTQISIGAGLRDQINAATTAEDLETIQWPTS